MQASDVKAWLDELVHMNEQMLQLSGARNDDPVVRHGATLNILVAEHIVEVFDLLGRAQENRVGDSLPRLAQIHLQAALEEQQHSTLKLLQARAACITRTRIDRNEAAWRATGLDVAPEPDQVPVWSDPA